MALCNGNIDNFLNSIIENKIITIAGTSGSGKTWLLAYITEFLLIKYKSLVMFNTDTKTIEILKKFESFKTINYYTEYDATNFLHTIKDLKNTILAVEDFNIFNNNDFEKKSDFIYEVRRICVENNLTLIITIQSVTRFSGSVINPKLSTFYQIADTVCVCKKDNNELIFDIEKSRAGLSGNFKTFNITKAINKYVRLEKIKRIEEMFLLED